MVSQTLLSELNVILQEDYKVVLPPPELAEVANALVGMFELLAKMDIGQEEGSVLQNRNITDNGHIQTAWGGQL